MLELLCVYVCVCVRLCVSVFIPSPADSEGENGVRVMNMEHTEIGRV